MSERTGPISVLPQEGDPRMAGVSDALLNAVDEEARRITDECYAEARRLLSENRHRLDALVEQLLQHETLDETDVYAAVGMHPPSVAAGSATAGTKDRLAGREMQDSTATKRA